MEFYILISKPRPAMTKQKGEVRSLEQWPRQPVRRPSRLFRYSPYQRDLKNIIHHEKGTPVIELHRMTREEATNWCAYFIVQFPGKIVQFIVGKGSNSLNGPVLKPMVQKMLVDHNIAHGEVPGNSGRIYAVLNGR